MNSNLTAIRSSSAFKSSVPLQVLADFFDHLATLLASGIPLLRTLEFARGAIKHKKLDWVLGEVISKISSGAQLSEALDAYPSVFDQVVLGMIRAAEASGHLEGAGLELGRMFQGQAEMRSRLFQALAYPLLVAFVGMITVCVLLIFVIPKLATVFEVWDTPLPIMTRILLAVSDFLSHGGFLVLIALIIALLFSARLLAPQKRKQISFFIAMKIPFVKNMFFLSDFVRLTRTWGMLLKNGVPLIEAIDSSKAVLWDPKIQSALSELREKTLRGSALQEAINDELWFPELAKSFLSVGEATGTLDQSFEKIAVFYERELDRKIKLMGTFLEPMLILGIGLVVGFLVISLLLPIFEMSLVVR